MSTLGDRLRAARERKGWKQIYVCERLGLSSSTMSGYERNYREPDAETLGKLADLYEVTIDFLVNGKNEPLTDGSETVELDKLLSEVNAKVLYRGLRLTESEKKKINDVLTGLFWDEIKRNSDK